ncbi:unnamed protein product [Discosporangium mesarthrocarpum]
MGNSPSGSIDPGKEGVPPVPTPAPQLGKSGKKICCSCPETKRARDECVVFHGEDACSKAIEAHKECLRAEGFTVR